MTTKHPEILLVPQDMETVACNGGGNKNAAESAALGHPKVFYTFHGQDEVTCGYCDRLFTKKHLDGAVPYKKSA